MGLVKTAVVRCTVRLRDAFVLAGHVVRLLLDLVPELIEIDEALVEVEELAPFSAIAGGCVDQLDNEQSACHNASAAWEEIALDDADRGMVVHLLFEYTGFACRLAANLQMEMNREYNQLGYVLLPTCKGHASCGMESKLSKGIQQHDVGDVLEFLNELYEVLVH